MLESDVLLDALEIFKSTNSIFFIKSSHSFLPFISSNTSRFCSSNLSLRSRLRESDAEIRRRSPKFVSVSLSVNRGDGFGSDSTRELGKNGENSGEEESVVYEDVRERKGRRSSAINTTKHLWAGAVAAMVSRTLVAPLERLKLEYIVRGEHKHIFELIQTIATTQGIKGFWKGNFVNILRTAPFKAINFYAYDTYRNYLCNLSGNEEATNFERFVAGAAAGITATLLCLPMDTVKW